MQSTNKTPEEVNPSGLSNNVNKAILTFFIIIITAYQLQQLLFKLDENNNFVKILWEPTEMQLVSIVPIFILISVILAWKVAKKGSDFKQIFKVLSIFAIILFIIGLWFMAYLFGLASAFQH